MGKFLLKDVCRVSSGYEDDRFVGIQINAGIPAAVFPLGYCLGESDADLRCDILLLIKILKKFSPDHYDSRTPFKTDTDSENLFPLFSYQRIINYYINNGNYSENEVIYSHGNRGKIHWTKTVKQRKAHINHNNAVYLDFIIKNSNVNQQTLLTEIYRHCVYISFMKIGWLYTDFKYPKPQMKFNKKLFVSAVMKKLAETYNDKNKELFTDMLTILQAYNDETDAFDKCTFGTYSFEYVWERLIDCLFGIKDKSRYFPRTVWHLDDERGMRENHCLEPDTIMINDLHAYILDAKYYRYGCTGIASHLPDTSSIHKQITYGEHLSTTERHSFDKIYNAFLMPADLQNGIFACAGSIRYIGYAESDWKINDLDYERVAGMLVDTKTAMTNYCSKNTLRSSLLSNFQGII